MTNPYQSPEELKPEPDAAGEPDEAGARPSTSEVSERELFKHVFLSIVLAPILLPLLAAVPILIVAFLAKLFAAP